MYTPMTLGELMEAQEGEGIQFKEAKNRFDFAWGNCCFCALSNCGGGKLVGSQAFEQPERTRKGLIDKLHIMVDFQVYEHEGKRVLVFEIAGRPVGLPVQADGVAWWYEGDSLIPMPETIVQGI